MVITIRVLRVEEDVYLLTSAISAIIRHVLAELHLSNSVTFNGEFAQSSHSDSL